MPQPNANNPASRPDVRSILAIEVPIIARLGDRRMRVSEVMDLLPGRIIELDKAAEEELEIFVNNRRIGRGSALKVGENFGIRITSVEALHERIVAMRDPPAAPETPASSGGGAAGQPESPSHTEAEAA